MDSKNTRKHNITHTLSVLHVRLLAPWILYMVTVATQRSTDNRLSLVTFPVGAAVSPPFQTDSKLNLFNEALNYVCVYVYI